MFGLHKKEERTEKPEHLPQVDMDKVDKMYEGCVKILFDDHPIMVEIDLVLIRLGRLMDYEYRRMEKPNVVVMPMSMEQIAAMTGQEEGQPPLPEKKDLSYYQ